MANDFDFKNPFSEAENTDYVYDPAVYRRVWRDTGSVLDCDKHQANLAFLEPKLIRLALKHICFPSYVTLMDQGY